MREGGPAQGDVVGLYYMRGRWYDPQAGRFIQEDPLGVDGSLNLYSFAGDDPVNGSDPSGLDHSAYRHDDCWSGTAEDLKIDLENAQVTSTCVRGDGGVSVYGAPGSDPLDDSPIAPDPSAPLPTGPGGRSTGGPTKSSSTPKWKSAACGMSGAELGLAVLEDATIGPELLAAEGLTAATGISMTRGILHVEVEAVPLAAGSAAVNGVATTARSMGVFTRHWAGEIAEGTFVANARSESYFTRETAMTLIPFVNLLPTGTRFARDCF